MVLPTYFPALNLTIPRTAVAPAAPPKQEVVVTPGGTTIAVSATQKVPILSVVTDKIAEAAEAIREVKAEVKQQPTWVKYALIGGAIWLGWKLLR